MTASFSKFVETKTSALLDKHGAFFAFSNKQIDEGLEENKAKGFSADKADYCQVSGGMILPKSNVGAFSAEYDAMMSAAREEYLNTYTKAQIIGYELSNHEAGYTGDISDTVDAVAHLGFAREDVLEVYSTWYEENKDYF